MAPHDSIQMKKFNRIYFVVGTLLTSLLLTACSSDNTTDLRAYTAEIKASSRGHIAPIPEFLPTTSYTYTAHTLGDPFVSWSQREVAVAEEKQEENGLRPDLGRRREALESFPLDTLRMVGIMERRGDRSALISSPDSIISRIKIGNYLGQNYGQVISIEENRVELLEIVADGLGGWQKRPASLALTE